MIIWRMKSQGISIEIWRSWNFVFIYDKAVIKDPLEEEKKGDS